MSSGRSPPTIGSRLLTVAPRPDAAGTSTVSSTPAPAVSSTSNEPGRTVITGCSVADLACTTHAPPNTECVAPSGVTSTTSLSHPDPVRSAKRPAISLPSADTAINTAAGLLPRSARRARRPAG